MARQLTRLCGCGRVAPSWLHAPASLRLFACEGEAAALEATRRSDAHSSAHRSHSDVKVNEAVPSACQGKDSSDGRWRKALENKLLYRSKQRGFLEMDLLIGLWAEKHVPTMSDHDLVQFNVVLEQENPDLFKWLTGQEPPPATMASSAPFKELRQYVQKQLDEHRPQAVATPQGATWLRGWDAWEKPGEKPAEKSGEEPGQAPDEK